MPLGPAEYQHTVECYSAAAAWLLTDGTLVRPLPALLLPGAPLEYLGALALHEPVQRVAEPFRETPEDGRGERTLDGERLVCLMALAFQEELEALGTRLDDLQDRGRGD